MYLFTSIIGDVTCRKSYVVTLRIRTSLVKRTYIRARKEILRAILDLRFTITLVKRSPDDYSLN